MKAIPSDDIWNDERPGAYVFSKDGYGDVAGLIFRCPCGCGELAHIGIGDAGWSWDGDESAPTLHPSLNNPDGCGWHGWLRGGRWVL